MAQGQAEEIGVNIKKPRLYRLGKEWYCGCCSMDLNFGRGLTLVAAYEDWRERNAIRFRSA